MTLVATLVTILIYFINDFLGIEHFANVVCVVQVQLIINNAKLGLGLSYTQQHSAVTFALEFLQLYAQFCFLYLP